MPHDRRAVRLQSTDGTRLTDLLADFTAAGEHEVPGWFLPPDTPIDHAAHLVEAWSRGDELRPGWVPCTTLFLAVDDTFAGLVNIRHTLTPALSEFGGHIGYAIRPTARRRGHATWLLARALELLRTQGTTPIVLTCAPDNLGSSRAILNNGGHLDAEYFLPRMNRHVQRYLID